MIVKQRGINITKETTWKRRYIFEKKLDHNICIWIRSIAHILSRAAIFTVDLLWSTSMLMAFTCIFLVPDVWLRSDSRERKWLEYVRMKNTGELPRYIWLHNMRFFLCCRNLWKCNHILTDVCLTWSPTNYIAQNMTYILIASRGMLNEKGLNCLWIYMYIYIYINIYISILHQNKCVRKMSKWMKFSHVRAPIANMAKVKKTKCFFQSSLRLSWRMHNVIFIRFKCITFKSKHFENDASCRKSVPVTNIEGRSVLSILTISSDGCSPKATAAYFFYRIDPNTITWAFCLMKMPAEGKETFHRDVAFNQCL